MTPKASLLTPAVLLAIALSCGPAQAAWYWTHGHGGHPENELTVTFARKAIGLEIQVAGEELTVVHYAVPSPGDTSVGARHIRLKYELEAIDTQIAVVRIFNGNNQVRVFNVNWNTPGVNKRTLDLGTPVIFNRGMGVSIDIVGGLDSGADKITFHGVGADFIPIP